MKIVSDHKKFHPKRKKQTYCNLTEYRQEAEGMMGYLISLYRAHVGGRFGRRSRLVKVDFAFSLVKREVQVAL